MAGGCGGLGWGGVDGGSGVCLCRQGWAEGGVMVEGREGAVVEGGLFGLGVREKGWLERRGMREES